MGLTGARQQSKEYSGFTVVEIAVVLAIFVALSLILLPTLQRARESAHTATCASHLMQIGIAFQLYADDNTGHYPYHVKQGNCWWLKRIEPYVKNTAIFECPSAPDAYATYDPACPPTDGSTDPPTQFAGSYDLALHPDHLVGRLSFFTHPDSTILVLDGRGHPVSPASDPINSPQDLIRRLVQIRHNGGDNLLFADKHVKWFRLEAMANRHLWLAGDTPPPDS